MSNKSDKLAKLLEEQLVKGMSSEQHKGRLTLANTLTGEERTIAGDYYTFRATMEALEQPLGELWGISVQYSEDGGEIVAESPQWRIMLETEAHYRKANNLPAEKGVKMNEETMELLAQVVAENQRSLDTLTKIVERLSRDTQTIEEEVK